MKKNKWDELQQSILERHPSIKTLPWHQRIAAHFTGWVSEYTVTVNEGQSRYSQTCVLVNYKGKEYVKRFGRLY